MRIQARAVVAWLALGLASCTGTTVGNDRCASTVECDAGEACVDGVCRQLGTSCGDGAKTGAEECDDGAENGDTKACTSACRVNVCGDGLLLEGVEGCDDGNLEVEACAYGVPSCSVCGAECAMVASTGSFCGDGTLDMAEACDDGNNALEACAYGEASCDVCGPSCTVVAGLVSYCGDGVTDPENGETCDGAGSSALGCPYGHLSCMRCGPSCSFIPGNIAFCGDRRVNGDEECDDGNFEQEPCAYGETSCQVCDWTCRYVAGATTYCGDGVVDFASGEVCDGGAGCDECRALPGWECNAGTCIERGYRVALMDASGLIVRNVSASGVSSVIRDVLRGVNPASLRPAWSWDGSLVAYPVGDYLNETYLYQGAGTAAAIDSFVGTQPSFGYSPSRAVARRVDGYAVWDEATLTDVGASLASTMVREPAWEPGGTTRFAYIDAAAAPGELEVFTGATSFSVSPAVQRYAWDPLGGAIAYVTGTTSCSVKVASVGALAAEAGVVVATGVPCDALLAFSPSGDRLALAAGAKVYELALDGSVYVISSDEGLAYTSGGTVVDLGFAPDADFVLVLAYESGSAGARRLYLWSAGATLPVTTNLTCACDRMAIAPVTFAP